MASIAYTTAIKFTLLSLIRSFFGNTELVIVTYGRINKTVLYRLPKQHDHAPLLILSQD